MSPAGPRMSTAATSTAAARAAITSRGPSPRRRDGCGRVWVGEMDAVSRHGSAPAVVVGPHELSPTSAGGLAGAPAPGCGCRTTRDLARADVGVRFLHAADARSRRGERGSPQVVIVVVKLLDGRHRRSARPRAHERSPDRSARCSGGGARLVRGIDACRSPRAISGRAMSVVGAWISLWRMSGTCREGSSSSMSTTSRGRCARRRRRSCWPLASTPSSTTRRPSTRGRHASRRGACEAPGR